MQKYKVMRRHLGDRLYEPGDEREATEGDVAHLVANGVLEAPKAKAMSAPENKGRSK